MKIRLITVLICLFALCQALFGAEITIPSLELVSQGAMDHGNFEIRSSIEAKIAITGGYKYGFSLGLGAEIPNLGKALAYGRVQFTDPWSPAQADELSDRLNNQAVISIRSINATVREVFNWPLDLSFFVGAYDKLGSGDDFQESFGTSPIGSALRGFYYYPKGFNEDPFFRFDGAMHTIKGTGLALKARLGNFIPAFYLYHDLSYPDDPLNPGAGYKNGRYSADIRLLANTENAKFEVFFGGTYGILVDGFIRGGAMAWFSGGPFSLLLQAGITQYKIGETFDIDNCYFLMEPRLHFNKFGAELTFFYHPVYYQNKIIYDDITIPVPVQANGRADINLKLYYGNITRSTFAAGLEGLVSLKIQNGENLSVWVSPFVSTVTTGLRWDIALRLNPLYFMGKGDLMEGFVGIRTSY